MYTLSRGPSKIAASSRRGPPRQVDLKSFDNRSKLSSKNGSVEDNLLEMSSQRPTFQPRRQINKKTTPPPGHGGEVSHEYHNDMKRLLAGQWRKVEEGLRKSTNQDDPAWKVYREKDPDNSLEDFVPFDVESLWYLSSKNSRGKPS